MQAKPRSTYTVASPATWELVRAAYLSGLSAPTVAARFGVSEGAIRKRAGRDGWTKRAFADKGVPPLAGSAIAPPPAPPPDSPLHTLQAAMTPVSHHPDRVARRALHDAVAALAEGRPEHARRLLAATETLIRLDRLVGLVEEEESPEAVEARQSLMRLATYEMALDLARTIAAGGPLPPQYAELERARLSYPGAGPVA